MLKLKLAIVTCTFQEEACYFLKLNLGDSGYSQRTEVSQSNKSPTFQQKQFQFSVLKKDIGIKENLKIKVYKVHQEDLVAEVYGECDVEVIGGDFKYMKEGVVNKAVNVQSIAGFTVGTIELCYSIQDAYQKSTSQLSNAFVEENAIGAFSPTKLGMNDDDDLVNSLEPNLTNRDVNHSLNSLMNMTSNSFNLNENVAISEESLVKEDPNDTLFDVHARDCVNVTLFGLICEKEWSSKINKISFRLQIVAEGDRVLSEKFTDSFNRVQNGSGNDAFPLQTHAQLQTKHYTPNEQEMVLLISVYDHQKGNIITNLQIPLDEKLLISHQPLYLSCQTASYLFTLNLSMTWIDGQYHSYSDLQTRLPPSLHLIQISLKQLKIVSPAFNIEATHQPTTTVTFEDENQNSKPKKNLIPPHIIFIRTVNNIAEYKQRLMSAMKRVKEGYGQIPSAVQFNVVRFGKKGDIKPDSIFDKQQPISTVGLVQHSVIKTPSVVGKCKWNASALIPIYHSEEDKQLNSAGVAIECHQIYAPSDIRGVKSSKNDSLDSSKDNGLTLVGFVTIPFSSVPKESIGCWRYYSTRLINNIIEGSVLLSFDLKIPLSLYPEKRNALNKFTSDLDMKNISDKLNSEKDPLSSSMQGIYRPSADNIHYDSGGPNSKSSLNLSDSHRNSQSSSHLDGHGNHQSSKLAERLIKELDAKTDAVKKIGNDMYQLRVQNTELENKIKKLQKKLAVMEQREQQALSTSDLETVTHAELQKRFRILSEKFKIEVQEKSLIIDQLEKMQTKVMDFHDKEKKLIELQTAHTASSIYIQKLQEQLTAASKYKDIISQQEKIIKKFEKVLDTKSTNSNGLFHILSPESTASSSSIGGSKDPMALKEKMDIAEISLFNVLAQENRKLKDRNMLLEKHKEEFDSSFSVTRLKQVEKELDDARAKIVQLERISTQDHEDDYLELVFRAEAAEYKAQALADEMIDISRKYQAELAKLKVNKDVQQAYQQQQQSDQPSQTQQIPSSYFPPLRQSPHKKGHSLHKLNTRKDSQLERSSLSFDSEEDD